MASATSRTVRIARRLTTSYWKRRKLLSDPQTIFQLNFVNRYKDGELKRMTDPLSLMSSYLKKRDEVKEAAERHQGRGWEATPASSSIAPPSMLGPKRRRGDAPLYQQANFTQLPSDDPPRRSHRPEADDDAESFGPAPPPVPKQVQEEKLKQSSQARFSSERARAQALKAEAKRKAAAATPSSVATPRSEYGYSDLFNKQETREAQARSGHLSRMRWDEDRNRDRDRSRLGYDDTSRRSSTSSRGQRYWS